MKWFPLIFVLLSTTAIKCFAAVCLWFAIGPAAAIAVVWMAFATWLTFAGVRGGTGLWSRAMSFVGELNTTLAFYGSIAVFDCYVLWYGLSRGSQEMIYLAVFALALTVGCCAAIRVSERHRAHLPSESTGGLAVWPDERNLSVELQAGNSD